MLCGAGPASSWAAPAEGHLAGHSRSHSPGFLLLLLEGAGSHVRGNPPAPGRLGSVVPTSIKSLISCDAGRVGASEMDVFCQG